MEMPFKPMINKVSRTIMTKKKSLGDLCGSNTSSNIKVTIKPKNEDHIFHE
jgi:ribosomal protein L7Ae-like RNA K-turn-binding protein